MLIWGTTIVAIFALSQIFPWLKKLSCTLLEISTWWDGEHVWRMNLNNEMVERFKDCILILLKFWTKIGNKRSANRVIKCLYWNELKKYIFVMLTNESAGYVDKNSFKLMTKFDVWSFWLEVTVTTTLSLFFCTEWKIEKLKL